MNAIYYLLAVIILIPIASIVILVIKDRKNLKNYKSVDLNDVKKIPLNKQASFLMTALQAGIFSMHRIINDAKPHNDKLELKEYRDFANKQYNIDAIKEISKKSAEEEIKHEW